MTNYTIRFTDISNSPIIIEEDSIITNVVDVTLFGKIVQDYGQDVNEDLLNILENFSCPEDSLSVSDNDCFPDISQVSKNQLLNPLIGQFWFNSTRKKIYFYNGTRWNLISNRGIVAANWGQILHGEQLPRPVSPVSGYVFPYNECIWMVSPTSITGPIDSLQCSTDDLGNVNIQYRYINTDEFVTGIANYLIIGISGNINGGSSLI